MCHTVPQSPQTRSRATSGVAASPLSAFREVMPIPVSFSAGYPSPLIGPERNSPVLTSRVTKFPSTSTTSVPSSPQYQSRQLGVDAGNPAGFSHARPPKPVSNMVTSPTYKNRIIGPDQQTSPTLTHRITKMAAPPTSKVPSSPNIRNRIVNPEAASPMLGSRTLREPPTFRETPSAPSAPPRPIQVGTYAATTARSLATLNHVSSAGNTKQQPTLNHAPSAGSTLNHASTSGLLPQSSPAMRVFRGPRHSKPMPASISQPIGPTTTDPQRGPRSHSQAPGAKLQQGGNSQKFHGINSHQPQANLLQPQGTPGVRTRSPLRMAPGAAQSDTEQQFLRRSGLGQSPSLSHRTAPNTPQQFVRSPGTPQTLFSRNFRVAPSQAGDVTAAAIAAGLGHDTPRSNSMM
jgi:hypothetical protein